MLEDHWKDLLYALTKGKCVVLLGAGLSVKNRDSVTRPLTEWLALELADQLTQDYPDHPLVKTELSQLLYVATEYYNKKGKYNLLSAVEGFYSKHAKQCCETHSLLAELPLGLIICSSPDLMVSEAYRQLFKSFDAAHYAYSKDRTSEAKNNLSEENDSAPDASPDNPLVYHLLGSISNPDSLILTEKDRLNFLEDIIRHNNAISNKVLKQMTKDKIYLFLGFDFEQWHLRLLLRALNLDEAQEAPLYAPNGQAQLNTGAMVFFQRQYKLEFLQISSETFVRELHERYFNAPQPTPVNDAVEAKINVYYMYHEQDEALKVQLDQSLAPLRLSRKIKTWDESKLLPGAEWKEEIARQIEQANLVLLLVSSDFMASEELYQGQLQQALQRQRQGKAAICPILARPSYYETAVFSKLHSILPRNKKFITLWDNEDEAFRHIAMEVEKIVDVLTENLKT